MSEPSPHDSIASRVTEISRRFDQKIVTANLPVYRASTVLFDTLEQAYATGAAATAGEWHASSYGTARHFSPASIPGAHEHTLSFYSFSKNYGMASWRVGYVVYPLALSEAMNKVQDTNLICAPVASQLLAAESLKKGRAIVDPQIDALARVRRTVHESLASLGDLIEFPRTEGAFYVLMKLPGVDDALAFNRAMVERHKVATIPGFAFGLTDTKTANYQRLSYGALDAASVAEGVQRFVAAVKDWYRR